MPQYLGDFSANATVIIWFTTNDSSGAAVAPSSAFEASDVFIVRDDQGTASYSASVSMTSPWNSKTGVHLIKVDMSAATFGADADYAALLIPDETVDGKAVAAVIGQWSVTNRFPNDIATLTNLNALSANLATNIEAVSAGLSDQMDTMSANLATNITALSAGHSARIQVLSASLNTVLATLATASGLSTTSANLATNITTLSANLQAALDTLSASLGDQIAGIAAGSGVETAYFDTALSTMSANLATNLTTLSAGHSARIQELSSSLNTTLSTLATSTALSTMSANLATNITALSAGHSTRLDVLSASLASQITTLSANLATSISDAVWNEARADHTTTGTYGVAHSSIAEGVAEAGTLSTTVMTTNLTESTDDHYVGRTVVFIAGALDGQASDITAYLGSTGQLTFTALTESPIAGQRFIIV